MYNKEIRKLGYRGLIIGVTGNAMQTDIDTFISHGADEVLIKPMNIDDLKVILAEGLFSNWVENEDEGSGIGSAM